jgi:hypothetical protein
VEQVTSDTLSRLRHVANECLRTHYGYTAYQDLKAELSAERVLALVECAEVVHTDYLLLSGDQQMRAANALKELGL